jgi:uncharacterized protein
MPIYTAPDVYVEEVAGGAKPIEMVGTSTAGFVGVLPNVEAPRNEPIAINNWAEFVRRCAGGDSPSTPLANAVFGFFQNGGSRCYVVGVEPNAPIGGGGRERTGLAVLEQVDEVAIVAAPGYTDAASYDSLLSHCENLGDRVAILDTPEEVRDLSRLTETAVVTIGRRGAEAREEEEGGAGGERTIREEQGGLAPRDSDGGYGACYFPWLTVRDALTPSQLLNVPPSGHIAGIWARTDATRGVHKAPANELVRGSLNVTYALTRAEQGELNQAGINCIRIFAREGIRVWGARTVARTNPEWRYLNVRRLFNMIKESIGNSTRWVVFEPNDYTLWKSIRRDVAAFLTRLWREGALMGRTPEEAFFVKCDEETNPPEVTDAGMVVTLIGIAPVKPAEFIVFRVSQYQAGMDVESEGGARG